MKNEADRHDHAHGEANGRNQATDLKDIEKLAEIQHRSFWIKVVERFHGYDFFISYRWSDGRHYALQLAEDLQNKGYNCFLDSEGYRPGENWLWGGRYALMNTSRLIFLATRDSVTDPKNRSGQTDPIVNELRAFEEGGRQKVRVLLDAIDDTVWKPSPMARFFRDEDLFLSDLDRTRTDVVGELDRWARIDKVERKRTHLFQGIAIALSILLSLAVIAGIFARSQANRLRAVAVEGLVRGGFENLASENNAKAASDFASALDIDPQNQIAADRLYSMLAYGPPQWVLQQTSNSESVFRRIDSWIYAGTGLAPVSKQVDDDKDNSETVTASRFQSPDRSWSVDLMHYGGNFQAVQLPFYQIQLSENERHDFEENAEVKNLVFNQDSTLVAVTLDIGQVYVFSRTGMVANVQCNGVLGVSFTDDHILVCHIQSGELRFHDPLGNRPVPAPFKGSRIVAYTRHASHWLIAAVDGNIHQIWSYPTAPQSLARTFDAATPGPRDWKERAKVAPLRGLALNGIRGDWSVVESDAMTSKWKALSHPLSSDDQNQHDLKNETFAATTAFVTEDATISANGKLVVTAAGRTNPRVWREGAETWEKELPIDNRRYVEAVKLDATGKVVLVLYSDEGPTVPTEYALFTTDTGEQIASGTLRRLDQLLDVSPDCKRILVQVDRSGDAMLEIRSILRDAEPILIPGDGPAVFDVDGRRLAIRARSGGVRIYDPVSKHVLSESLMFPTKLESPSFREPHFSLSGEFVEVHEYGQPGKRCTWRVRTNLSPADTKRLALLARQYFGVDIEARRPAFEMVQEFSAAPNSVIAELARFLFSADTFR